MAIKGTHAYVLVTLKDIVPGQPISVSYTKNGYYEPDQKCLCSTCQPDDPPVPPAKRPVVHKDLTRRPGPKKRRGGKRARVRRENRIVREEASCGGTTRNSKGDMGPLIIIGSYTLYG
jgi:hypothetical protein